MIDINVNYVLEILRDVDSCEDFAPAWGAPWEVPWETIN